MFACIFSANVWFCLSNSTSCNVYSSFFGWQAMRIAIHLNGEAAGKRDWLLRWLLCCAGHNACGNHNGGCSHLCLAHSADHVDNKTHHCACPTHYRLNADRLTCQGQCRPLGIKTFVHLNDNNNGTPLPHLGALQWKQIPIWAIFTYSKDEYTHSQIWVGVRKGGGGRDMS